MALPPGDTSLSQLAGELVPEVPALLPSSHLCFPYRALGSEPLYLQTTFSLRTDGIQTTQALNPIPWNVPGNGWFQEKPAWKCHVLPFTDGQGTPDGNPKYIMAQGEWSDWLLLRAEYCKGEMRGCHLCQGITPVQLLLCSWLRLGICLSTDMTPLDSWCPQGSMSCSRRESPRMPQKTLQDWMG